MENLKSSQDVKKGGNEMKNVLAASLLPAQSRSWNSAALPGGCVVGSGAPLTQPVA